MGKLESFLRKEVRKTRAKPPRNDRKRTPTPPPFSYMTDREFTSERELSVDNDNHALFGQRARDDVDSLFGERVPSKEEIQHAKLERFLAQNPSSHKEKPAQVSQQQKDIDARIQTLKDELKTLLPLTNESTAQERNMIHRQRKALEEEISYLEAEARFEMQVAQPKIVRARSWEERVMLPEPLSAAEKRKIEREKARKAKEMLEAEKPKPKPKRKRGEYNPDDDLDGEERLRCGKSLKRKPVEVTGRWNSTLHDYFPDGEEEANIENMSKDEKKLYRRELAELGEQLALADRMKKRRGE